MGNVKPGLLFTMMVIILLMILGAGATWAYFHGTADELITISVGTWESPPGQAGTSIDADKTATGFWEQAIEYDWTAAKTVDQGEVVVPTDESVMIKYKITVTRHEPTQREEYGVRGEVCVTNEGEQSTENLKIVDFVQYKLKGGEFQDLDDGKVIDVSKNPILGPGESYCYLYEVTFEPVGEAKAYRNVTKVTITNHSGWLPEGEHCPGPDPCPFGPEPKEGFSLLDEPTILYEDTNVEISDEITCPIGFTCTSTNPGPWTFTDSDSQEYKIETHNDTVSCGAHQLVNMVTLKELTTESMSVVSASVSLNAGMCLDEGNQSETSDMEPEPSETHEPGQDETVSLEPTEN